MTIFKLDAAGESFEQGTPQPKIFSSAEQGDISTIEDLLRHDPGMVNIQNDAGWTALTYAVANGHNDLAEVVIQTFPCIPHFAQIAFSNRDAMLML